MNWRLNFVGELPQRRDVIKNPERTAVRCDDQIITFDYQIMNRRDRQVELQRLPCAAIG